MDTVKVLGVGRTENWLIVMLPPDIAMHLLGKTRGACTNDEFALLENVRKAHINAEKIKEFNSALEQLRPV